MQNVVKILIIIAVLGAAVYGGYLWYDQNFAKEGVEDLLPQGAVVYYKENDAAESFDRFTKTEFWQKLTSIDLQKLMLKSDVSQQDQMMLDFVLARILTLPENLALERYFGQEFAVAVYPIKFSDYSSEALLRVGNAITFITKLSPEDKFIDFISLVFQQVGQEYISRTVSYRDNDVTIVTIPQLAIPDLKIAFTRINDYVAFGLGEKAAHGAINVSKQQIPSLRSDANFNMAKASFQNNAQSVSYINMETLFTGLKGSFIAMATADQAMSPEQQQEMRRSLEKTFESMKGFKAIGASTIYDEMVHLRSDYYYDPNTMLPQVRKLYDCSPKDNPTIKFVPRDVLLYQWTDCYDLNYYWDELKAEMESQPDVGEGPSMEVAVAGAESFLGVSIENELLPALGKEQGWVLSEIDTTGAFPMPKFLLFLKTLNQATVEQIFKKITDQPFLFVQSEQYKNFDINYVSLPLGVDIKPGYMFIDGYLLFSSSADLLKDCINAREDQRLSLISDPLLQEIKINLKDKSNGVFFLKLSELVEEIRGAVDWGTNWYLAKVRQMEAYKTGSQQRLVDINDEMQLLNNQLNTQKERLNILSQERDEGRASGNGTQDVDISIEQVRSDVDRIESSLEELITTQTELEQIVESYTEEQPMDSGLLKFYMDEALYPVLEAIGSIKLIGTKMTMKNSVIETISAIQFQ